jgi:hypothetical protein
MFTPTLETCWSWEGVIERNTGLLKPIIAALFVLLEGAARLKPGVYRRVLRLLRPTESAVRRLIVIAARGVVVKPVAVRAMPFGPITGRGEGKCLRSSFQLFDTRKRFAMLQPLATKRVLPRIRVLMPGYDPRVAAIFAARQRAAMPPPAPQPVSDGLVDAARITRRLHALKSALDDLPRQAKRLARWRLKRASTPRLRIMHPMRFGHAPGYRKKKRHEIDDILADCHYFACEAIRNPDTS